VDLGVRGKFGGKFKQIMWKWPKNSAIMKNIRLIFLKENPSIFLDQNLPKLDLIEIKWKS
jgi:hypothetical protein